jgi:hypothetical protein
LRFLRRGGRREKEKDCRHRDEGAGKFFEYLHKLIIMETIQAAPEDAARILQDAANVGSRHDPGIAPSRKVTVIKFKMAAEGFSRGSWIVNEKGRLDA